MSNGEQPNPLLLFFGGLAAGIISSLIAQAIYDYYKKETLIKTVKRMIR